MIKSLISALALLSVSATCAQTKAPQLFSKIWIQGDSLYATLVPEKSFLVSINKSEFRRADKAETFKLNKNDELKLSEKHASFLVTPSFSPRGGINIIYTFDSRSFGGVVTDTAYFQEAQKAEQGAAANP